MLTPLAFLNNSNNSDDNDKNHDGGGDDDGDIPIYLKIRSI